MRAMAIGALSLPLAWTVAWTLIGAGTGCGSKPPPRSGPTSALSADAERAREQAVAEARRADGVTRLAELAREGTPDQRAHALRGLGRVGDARATDLLIQALADPEPTIHRAAARALGIAAAADAEPALLARYPSLPDAASRAVAIEALGRLGGAASLAVLARAMADEPAVAAAAGLAMGRLGRRQVALDAAARQAAFAQIEARERDVRYAATYALAREHEPPDDTRVAVAVALAARAADADAEIRAVAIAGLARREGDRGPARAALADADWRVAVEAVRALTGPRARPPELAAVAAVLADAPMSGPRAHVATEALRALLAHATDPAVRQAARDIAARAEAALAGDDPAAVLGASAIHCLATAVEARAGGDVAAVLACGGDDRGMPRADRVALWAGAAVAWREPSAAAVAATLARRYAAQTDPRVRAALARAAADLAVAVADPEVARVVGELLVGAVADPAVEVAGTAAEGVATLAGQGKPIVAAGAPLLARAESAAGDIELWTGVVDALVALGARDAIDLCERARTADNAAVRAHARTCVTALSGSDPGPAEAARAPSPPPVELAPVVGRAVTWTLTTTRGEIAIALDPAVAPWHVAAIAQLSGRGFYDGLSWHRVVPNFVVQGGDPAGSGWGGPGFVIPGEASAQPFSRGAVGIADAGRDTGGSQIFIMHSRAPHLEGRYTWIGRVTAGHDAVDALMVGDRITRSRIDVGAPE